MIQTYPRAVRDPTAGIEFQYDPLAGLWLSSLFSASGVGEEELQPIATSGRAVARWSLFTNDYDVWVVDFRWYTYVNTVNSGVSFWTPTFVKGPSGTTIGTGTSTAADAADVQVKQKLVIGALLGTSSNNVTMFETKTLTPGTLYVRSMMTFKLVRP